MSKEDKLIYCENCELTMTEAEKECYLKCPGCGFSFEKPKDEVKSVDELFINHLEMMAFTNAMPVLAYLLKYGKMEIETLSELIFPLAEVDIIERLEFLKPYNIVDFNEKEAWLKRG